MAPNIRMYKQLVGEPLHLIYLENMYSTFGSSIVEGRALYLGGDKKFRVSLIWEESNSGSLDYANFAIESDISVPENCRSMIYSLVTAGFIHSVDVFAGFVANGGETEEVIDAVKISRTDGKVVCLTIGGSAFRNILISSDTVSIEEGLRKRRLVCSFT